MPQKTLLKKTALLIVCFWHCISFAQNVAVNATGATADKSAMLDVSATNKGLLIPRVSLINHEDAVTISTPATSLLVWNTNENMEKGDGVGYYFNSGTPQAPLWTKLAVQNPTAADWMIGGNSNILPGLHFMGTTNDQDVVFKRNSITSLQIMPGGSLLATGDAFAGTTPLLPNGYGMMWIPAKQAFRAGGVYGDQWADLNIGYNSFATGWSTTASGDRSVAMGDNSTASGHGSVALGGATASGASSTAMSGGVTTTTAPSAIAMGFGTQATKDYAVAMGVYSVASGVSSVAVGHTNTASGTASVAAGHTNTASGIASIALGRETIASQDYAVAAGYKTDATGLASMATGENTTASASHTFAGGLNSTASGIAAIAFGNNATAAGQYSIALGRNANVSANGTEAIAIGYMATAQNSSAVSLGYWNIALGAYSAGIGYSNYLQSEGAFAAGYDNSVIGNRGVALGDGNKSNGTASFTAGRENFASGISAVAIGNNDSATANYAVALGNNNNASGSSSVSMGANSISEGAYSFTMGNLTRATGSGAIAMGNSTLAEGNSSFATGSNTLALGQRSVALGLNTVADGDNSFAMGYDTRAHGYNSVALGRGTLAEARYSTVVGLFNDITASPNPDASSLTDRLFEIGGGQDQMNRRNAMTVLRSGFTGINMVNPTAYLHIQDDDPWGRDDIKLEHYFDGQKYTGYLFYDVNGLKFRVEDGQVVNFYTDGSFNNPTIRMSNAGMNVSGKVYADDFVNTSDIRLKNNIVPLHNVLAKINQIQPIFFNFNKNVNKSYKDRHIGFSAQEVQKQFPELVRENKDGFLGVNYGNMSAVLLQAIKEQQQIIDQLNKRMEVKEKENEQYKQQLHDLNKKMEIDKKEVLERLYKLEKNQ